jgi:hypothetical protein
MIRHCLRCATSEQRRLKGRALGSGADFDKRRQQTRRAPGICKRPFREGRIDMIRMRHGGTGATQASPIRAASDDKGKFTNEMDELNLD